MLRALPSALMVVFSVLFVKIFGASQGWSELEISTLLYYLLPDLIALVSPWYLEPACLHYLPLACVVSD